MLAAAAAAEAEVQQAEVELQQAEEAVLEEIEAAADAEYLTVTCPEGCGAGDALFVTTPSAGGGSRFRAVQSLPKLLLLPRCSPLSRPWSLATQRCSPCPSPSRAIRRS